MTEQDNTDPRKPGEGATADSEWRGDAGDQGNDLRFGEEQQLIEEQSQANASEGEHHSVDTSGGYTSHQERDHPGSYTDHDEQDVDVNKDVASSSGTDDDGRPDSQERHKGN